MSILGIGPSLAITGVATAVALIVVKRLTGYALALSSPWQEWGLVAGIFVMIIGVFFWLSAGLTVKRAFEARTLVTKGVFSVSRNPMYAGFILFIFPGLALALNDLLIIIISVALYVAFKARIGREEEFLLREFGEEYEHYRESVPQLVPFVHR